MAVRATLKRYAIEYVKGERELSECAVPEIRWVSLRRVLIATKRYHDCKSKGKPPGPSHLLEKKRSESKFWLETGIKWPNIDGEL